MKCFYHTDREAVATCQRCGKALCRECAAKYNPCLCDECKSILDATDRQAESDKRQKYLDALVDTRSEFIRACIAGVVVGLVFYSMFAGGGADAGSRVTCFVLGFFVPFGWKLLTYLQSFIPLTIFGTLGFWLMWLVFKTILSVMLGIPAFIYQLIKTFFVNKKIQSVRDGR